MSESIVGMEINQAHTYSKSWCSTCGRSCIELEPYGQRIDPPVSQNEDDTGIQLEVAKVHALIGIAEQLANLNRSISSAKRGLSGGFSDDADRDPRNP